MYFWVRFEKQASIEFAVEAKDRDELDRAINGTLEEGIDDWAIDTGDWELDYAHEVGKQFDPKASAKSGELQGIDASDPDNVRIVNYADRKPAPPETEDERRQREFQEAAKAGQTAFVL